MYVRGDDSACRLEIEIELLSTYRISGLKKAGLNQSKIDDEVGVYKSTISREFELNKNRRVWRLRQLEENVARCGASKLNLQE